MSDLEKRVARLEKVQKNLLKTIQSEFDIRWKPPTPEHSDFCQGEDFCTCLMGKDDDERWVNEDGDVEETE